MFTNRTQAGIELARMLQEESELPVERAVVISIPRGGIPVGSEIARAFNLPHDCLLTKKLRAPEEEELAIGAVGQTPGSKLINQKIISDLGVSKAYLDAEIVSRQAEIKRQESVYRNGRPAIVLANNTVVIVDDGVATGATMIVAIRQIFEQNPKRVVVASPVCAFDTLQKLEAEADSVITLVAPKVFTSISEFYEDFSPVSDEEVIRLMANN